MVRFEGATSPVMVLFCGLLGCSSPAVVTTEQSVEDEVEASQVSLHDGIPSDAFVGRGALVGQLCGDPFRYFRFINRGFMRVTCERFLDALVSSPSVNLHGDAHLEQLAVTSTGAGLSDFDDSTTGPVYIDLVRFGTSLQLICEAREWSCDGPLDAFLDGYRAALTDPDDEMAEPAFIVSVRSSLESNRRVFLEACSDSMVAVDERQARRAEASWSRYVDLMIQRNPELTREFFELKEYGKLVDGVGSALTPRYLLRVEGPAAGEDDDLILEVKKLSRLDGSECVKNDRFRTIVGRARLIGGEPDPFAAVIPRGADEAIDDSPFWVQPWQHDYSAVDHLAFDDPQDLAAVAAYFGQELGRGHVREMSVGFDGEFTQALVSMFDASRQRTLEEVVFMTEVTLQSWQVFRAERSCE